MSQHICIGDGLVLCFPGVVPLGTCIAILKQPVLSLQTGGVNLNMFINY